MQKVALIFGANGQDGSYLCELLLEKGYTVHGTIRRTSTINTERIDHIFEFIHLHYVEITDAFSVIELIKKVNPDEIYNFAAISHVKIASEMELYTLQSNTIGVLNILKSVMLLDMKNKTKIYQASTSEMYGNSDEFNNTSNNTSNNNSDDDIEILDSASGSLLHENSYKEPCSIYGISKMSAHYICEMYKKAHKMFIVSSILFNHEGPRRGHNFVTKKIANYVAEYKLREQYKNEKCRPLILGNLDAKRDWGHARDYVEAIYMMMQKDEPENYVIATGETHSVREFVEESFKCIDIQIEWKGTGLDEIGLKKGTNIILVKVSNIYYRDIDIKCLIGDNTKAKEQLSWRPKVTFKELVKEMINCSYDIHLTKQTKTFF